MTPPLPHLLGTVMPLTPIPHLAEAANTHWSTFSRFQSNATSSQVAAFKLSHTLLQVYNMMRRACKWMHLCRAMCISWHVKVYKCTSMHISTFNVGKQVCTCVTPRAKKAEAPWHELICSWFPRGAKTPHLFVTTISMNSINISMNSMNIITFITITAATSDWSVLEAYSSSNM